MNIELIVWIIRAVSSSPPRRNPKRYRRCISKSDNYSFSQEKEKVKERSAQIEEKCLPSILTPSSLSSRKSSVYTLKKRSQERKRDDEERIGGFTFLIYRSRCQRSPSSRQYLENLKGAAARAGLRGLSFLLPSPLIYLGAQLFPSIDAIKNKIRPKDRVSASPIWRFSLFIWSFSLSLFSSVATLSCRHTLNKKYITIRSLYRRISVHYSDDYTEERYR